MRKVHLVSGAEPLLFDIALAIREKRYDVSISGKNFTQEMISRLAQSGCTFYGDGWFPEKLTKDINFVVLGSTVTKDNPELIKAKELGLLVQSIPEFIYQRVKEKTRVVIAGTRGKKTILSMVSYVLLKQKMIFDYAFTNKTDVLPDQVRMSYESRIALIEGDELVTSALEQRVRMEFYRPHIAVLTNIQWNESNDYDSLESYLSTYKSFITSIEREGKLIYFDGDEIVSNLADTIREDITAIPYGRHAIEEAEGKTVLSTRYGKFPVYIPDSYFLVNINAARLVCRQLGVKDSSFYQAISEYSLSLQL
ncbi:Mur ligase family protein [Massilibacteroides sp.]|uniref:Mur ligase family protein n=1 Tax=Massilibacteroides sp. TaxID=2034766 RepID=UPI00262616D0|nr:Mur ligase family protein [Massilibacteroides sp.]MDD4516279.1 Mur ligase family protein [Massilibacteroides sp.]